MNIRTLALALVLLSAGLATPVRAQIFLSNGLVAYYPFNGNANDASGNGMNGVVHGATLTSDRFGNSDSAYNFNGVSSYIETTNMLPDMPSATVSCWINLNALPVPYLYVFMDGNTAPGHDYCMNVGEYTNLHLGTSDNALVGEIIPPLTNNWIQVVAVADTNAGVLKFWLNGQLMTTETNSGNADVGYHSLLDIGCRAVYHDYIFNGAIDDLRIYNRALSDTEVQALYQYESATPSSAFLTNGLTAYYPFTGNANDASGNNNNGTVNGATLTTGRFGSSNAYSFNGSSWIQLPDSILPVEPPQVTISAWVLPNSASYSTFGEILHVTSRTGDRLVE